MSVIGILQQLPLIFPRSRAKFLPVFGPKLGLPQEIVEPFGDQASSPGTPKCADGFSVRSLHAGNVGERLIGRNKVFSRAPQWLDESALEPPRWTHGGK